MTRLINGRTVIGSWPKFDTSGVLLLIDLSVKAGHGSAVATTLHRVDETFARQDFLKRGLRVVAHSDVLHRAEDSREQISYKEPMLGKTHRFVLIVKKQAAGH